VRVPDEAGLGVAKMTLSFDGWKEGKVAPVTAEIPVIDVRAEKKGTKPEDR
jgi:hypothetical protein